MAAVGKRMDVVMNQCLESEVYKPVSIKWLKYFFTSTETVGLLGTGAQDGHLDFHTTPELYSIKTVREAYVLAEIWTEGHVSVPRGPTNE